MNTLLLDALQGKNLSRPPVWLMRQAGRYMPDYRALRQKYSFLEMVHTPELAAQVTLLPIEQLGVDAAILFSDILVIVEALGMKLHFDDGAGPRIECPLSGSHDVDSLPTPDIEHSLAYVKQAIQGLVPNLKVPLIGFSGAPFTIASYMIEGRSSRDLRKTKQWMLQDPKSFHKLLQHIAKHTITYLEQQVKAGVHAIQIFDSWANFLGHHQFREFSLAYMQTIVDGLREKNIPIILFCKGSSVFASQLAEVRPAAISLDWNCHLPTLQHQLPSTIALQGNLDPDILYAPADVIKKEVTTLLDGMKGNPSYIFNLGHGILPDIPF
ncbi:MAG: uroporphyrinogen decarboxylase, partial [Parachlamydiaceae bacterium]